jgi:hypothetical protein
MASGQGADLGGETGGFGGSDVLKDPLGLQQEIARPGGVARAQGTSA